MRPIPPTRLTDALGSPSRRHAVGSLLGLCLVGLGACSGLAGPQVITLGQTDLDRLLARHFPARRRLLELLDVTLAAPRLQLLPERNRLSIALDLATQERLSGRAGRARLDFDSALRYEPRDATLRLTQVRVQQLALDTGTPAPGAPGAPPTAPTLPTAPATSGLLARLGEALVESWLDEMVLYTLPAERLADLRRLGLTPGAVTITARGVEVTLARAG